MPSENSLFLMDAVIPALFILRSSLILISLEVTDNSSTEKSFSLLQVRFLSEPETSVSAILNPKAAVSIFTPSFL